MQEFRHRVADDFAPQTLGEFVAAWGQRKQQTWGVDRDGELGGLVTFEAWNPVSGTIHAMFKRSFWGQGIARDAISQVLAGIFERGYQKIVGLPYNDNDAILSLLKGIGFKREGVLRGQTKRDGVLVDLAVIGLTKEGFENAVANSSRTDGGGHIGGRVVEPQQDKHSDQNADVGTGGRGAEGPAPEHDIVRH